MKLLKIKNDTPVHFNDTSMPIGVCAFGGHSSSPAPAPAPAPTETDPEIEEAERKQKLLERIRNGRRQTILTSSTGLEPAQKNESILTKAISSHATNNGVL